MVAAVILSRLIRGRAGTVHAVPAFIWVRGSLALGADRHDHRKGARRDGHGEGRDPGRIAIELHVDGRGELEAEGTALPVEDARAVRASSQHGHDLLRGERAGLAGEERQVEKAVVRPGPR